MIRPQLTTDFTLRICLGSHPYVRANAFPHVVFSVAICNIWCVEKFTHLCSSPNLILRSRPCLDFTMLHLTRIITFGCVTIFRNSLDRDSIARRFCFANFPRCIVALIALCSMGRRSLGFENEVVDARFPARDFRPMPALMSFVLNLSTCVGLPVRCPPTTLRVSRKTREEVEVDTDGDATGPATEAD